MLRPSRRLFSKQSFALNLTLPSTTFPPRPPLSSPHLQAASDDLYKWQSTQTDRPKFVLHDGPPYANGPLHLGHAVNKILKDFILRTQIQKGNRVEYRPGWDCHGLPIELKALQAQKGGSGTPDAVSIRKQARALAEENVAMQKEGFRKWGVLGEWDRPYLTMDQDYEQRQLEIWRQMVEKGLIYRARRPVYWSPSSGSALAEAELEYDEAHVSTTAMVRYPIHGASKIIGDGVGAVIWTTTPWTLPANRAIAVNKAMEYCVVGWDGGNRCLIAKPRLEYFQEQMGETEIELIKEGITGVDLVGAKYANVLRAGEPQPFIHADFVTSSMGTGLVHIAPGHGFDDYLTGQKHELDILAPVDDKGRFTTAALPTDPKVLAGKSVHSEGTEAVLGHLKELETREISSKILLNKGSIQHKYPIDWRTKQPVIIRATHQWFADVASIKPAAIEALESVTFIPEAGKARLTAFVNSRSEWCVSRQRAWGMPIPALYRTDTPEIEAVMTPDSIQHIMAIIKKRGTDAWWSDAEDDTAWIPPNLEGSYIRGKDTMDVWFDSGTSWTLLKARNGEPPADVYLEGSDQHRGWFQSSLLTHIATGSHESTHAHPTAPFSKLITHGFTLDSEGRKMSKSLGNVISPEAIIDGSLLGPIKPPKNRGKNKKNTATKEVITTPKYDALGADSLRFWVASMDYTKDITVGTEVLSNVQGSLIKLRITLKWLLGNLKDFTPSGSTLHADVCKENIHHITDTVALHRLSVVSRAVHDAYTQYDFSRGLTALNAFTNLDLSSFYFEALKDRLYAGDEMERYPAQRVLLVIYQELLSMLAPITPLLVEEAWSHTPEILKQAMGEKGKEINPLGSVWTPFSLPSEITAEFGGKDSTASLDALFDMLSTAKSAVGQIQETMRNKKQIASGLETVVHLGISNQSSKSSLAELLFALGVEDGNDSISAGLRLAPVLGVSSVYISDPEETFPEDRQTVEELKDFEKIGNLKQWTLGENMNSQLVVGVRTMTSEEKKCVRCWRWLELTEESEQKLCERCESVLGSSPKE
jgi:isoleucyl-tRNA synthetase